MKTLLSFSYLRGVSRSALVRTERTMSEENFLSDFYRPAKQVHGPKGRVWAPDVPVGVLEGPRQFRDECVRGNRTVVLGIGRRWACHRSGVFSVCLSLP